MAPSQFVRTLSERSAAMCGNRDGKFVVPIMPAAASGWWLGQVLGEGKPIRKLNGVEVVPCIVNLLWVQNPEYSAGNTISASKCDLREFGSVQEATEQLKQEGAIV